MFKRYLYGRNAGVDGTSSIPRKRRLPELLKVRRLRATISAPSPARFFATKNFTIFFLVLSSYIVVRWWTSFPRNRPQQPRQPKVLLKNNSSLDLQDISKTEKNRPNYRIITKKIIECQWIRLFFGNLDRFFFFFVVVQCPEWTELLTVIF